VLLYLCLVTTEAVTLLILSHVRVKNITLPTVLYTDSAQIDLAFKYLDVLYFFAFLNLCLSPLSTGMKDIAELKSLQTL